jgi:hypothetical protein
MEINNIVSELNKAVIALNKVSETLKPNFELLKNELSQKDIAELEEKQKELDLYLAKINKITNGN